MTQKLFTVRRTALIPPGDGRVKRGNAGPVRYLTRKFALLGQKFRRERIDSGVKVVEDGVKSVARVERGSVPVEESPQGGTAVEPTTEETPTAPKEDVQADTTDETPSPPLLTPETAAQEIESTSWQEAEQDAAVPRPPSPAAEQPEIPTPPALTPAEITLQKEEAFVSSILSRHADRHIAEWLVVNHAAAISTPSLLRYVSVVTAKRVLNNTLVDMDVAELTPAMVKKIHSVYQLCRKRGAHRHGWRAFEIKIEFVLNEALHGLWRETRETFKETKGKSANERVLFHGTYAQNLTP
jgi:hypothetical protein